MVLNFTEKYRPQSFAEVKGQDLFVERLKYFYQTFGAHKKAIIFHGPPGTGKTTLAHVLAKEQGCELVELNASDLRNKEQLDRILRAASEQKSLFSKGKIILVDEVDGISVADRGGLPELLAIIEKSSFPIVITANDIWQQKFSLLRKRCELLQFKEIDYRVVYSLLRDIAQKEGIHLEDATLKGIAIKARGDIRAALNDLQSVKESLASLGERDKKEDIFDVLRRIFKEAFTEEMLELFDKTHLTLDEVFLWIEENLPYEYEGEELARGFEMLSLADVFRGRIIKRQHWRFVLYQNIFLSAGIALAKKNPRAGFTLYKKPVRVLKIWMANQKHAKRKALSAKYAKYFHISKERAFQEFYFISLLIGEETARQMNLENDDFTYIEEIKARFRGKVGDVSVVPQKNPVSDSPRG